MKCKLILTVITALVAIAVYGQREEPELILDNAKTLFNEDAEDGANYLKIISILTDLIDIDPDNMEARYYLGYAYSRLNSHDGKTMIDMNLDLVLKASEQFEIINQVTPHYTGEVISLHPNLKISSEWGSLAMSYLFHNKKDSAVWAFKEGQKRGGFEPFVLAFNRMLLDACSKKAILITSGDITTISLWFLQTVEGYRKDVAVVDLNMLNITWYIDFLLKNKTVAFDMPIQELDTLAYMSWTDSLVTIGDFSWKVKPSYYDHYLMRGDRVFLSLLRQNKFKRDLFFAVGIPENMMLSIEDYLSPMIVISKFVANKGVEQSYNDYKKTATKVLKLSEYLNRNNPDELRLFGYLRFNILYRANYYLDIKDMEKVRELMEIHDRYGREEDFPYQNEWENRILRNIRYRLESI